MTPPVKTPSRVARRNGLLLAASMLGTFAALRLHLAIDPNADLTVAPFAAPDAHRLRALGLDQAALAALQRSGHLLRVSDSVVLLPGADDRATEVLAGLPQPFTVSEARKALDTSRRVALPLLAHLDRSGRTVRLPDDSRRVRRTPSGSNPS